MTRRCRNFEKAYMEYCKISESPVNFHFWTMVSTVAGALRRRVWLDEVKFQWTPNFYMVLVADAGVLAKSTTLNNGMQLLKQIKGLNFGPDAVTWQSLVQNLGDIQEQFELDGVYYPMSALTLKVSELGTFLNSDDGQMLDVLTDLWDSPRGAWKKSTKTQGDDMIIAPWINLMSATTPAWIAQHINAHALEGGLIARCVFVFGHQKARFVPYPHMAMPLDYEEQERKLKNDLEHMATELKGQYRLTPSALRWGEQWYEQWEEDKKDNPLMTSVRTASFMARKPTHLHKTALILAACRRDELVIAVDDLKDADIALAQIEENLPKVFAKVNMNSSNTAMNAAPALLAIVERGKITRKMLYRELFNTYNLSSRDFETLLESAAEANEVNLIRSGYDTWIHPGPALGSIDVGEKVTDLPERSA
jgi:hypothetical protein